MNALRKMICSWIGHTWGPQKLVKFITNMDESGVVIGPLGWLWGHHKRSCRVCGWTVEYNSPFEQGDAWTVNGKIIPPREYE